MKKIALVITLLMIMSSNAVAFASSGNGVSEKTQIKDTVQLEKEQLQDESCIIEEEITLVTLDGSEVLVEDEKGDETQQRDRDRRGNTEMNKKTNRNSNGK